MKSIVPFSSLAAIFPSFAGSLHRRERGTAKSWRDPTRSRVRWPGFARHHPGRKKTSCSAHLPQQNGEKLNHSHVYFGLIPILLRPLIRRQNFFAQPDGLGCYFHVLVFRNEFNGFFEAQRMDGHEPDRLVGD
jgi:hypothetical protein